MLLAQRDELADQLINHPESLVEGSLLDIGKSGRRDLIPALRAQAKHGKPQLQHSAVLALARLGETPELQQIVCELSVTDMGGVSNISREDLPYIGGWYSIRLLDDVLHSRIAKDPEYPKGQDPTIPVGYPSWASAVEGLEVLIPSSRKFERNFKPQWDRYLREHRKELESLQPTGAGVDFGAAACQRKITE